jgi:nucleoside 2-deoxyribosyltransferase
MTTICIVGHRDIREDQQQRVREEIEKTLGYFLSLGKVETISLVASGADTIFYDVAEAMKVPIKIWLPFAEAVYRKDFTCKDLTKFNAILSEKNIEWTGVLPVSPSQEDKNEAYRKAAQKLVDRSDYLLAVWDGKAAEGIGGTADTVEYAWSKNKPVIHIHADRSPKNQLHHANPNQNLDALEKAAMQAKISFRIAWGLGIAFGLFSVIAFAPTLFFDDFFDEHPVQKRMLYVVELVCLPLSYWLLCYRAHQAKAVFVDKRIVAERQRVYEQFDRVRIALPVDEKNDITVSSYQDTPEMAQSKTALMEFVQGQIDYHYHNRVKKYSRNKDIMRRIMFGILVAFFVVVGLGFIEMMVELVNWDFSEKHHLHDYAQWLHYFWVVFPATYAALEVVVYFNEWQLNIRVSKKTMLKLEAIKKEIVFADLAGFIKAMHELKTVLEIENEDWNILIDSKHIGAYI